MSVDGDRIIIILLAIFFKNKNQLRIRPGWIRYLHRYLGHFHKKKWRSFRMMLIELLSWLFVTAKHRLPRRWLVPHERRTNSRAKKMSPWRNVRNKNQNICLFNNIFSRSVLFTARDKQQYYSKVKSGRMQADIIRVELACASICSLLALYVRCACACGSIIAFILGMSRLQRVHTLLLGKASH